LRNDYQPITPVFLFVFHVRLTASVTCGEPCRSQMRQQWSGLRGRAGRK
jgi:hypothetical protein